MPKFALRVPSSKFTLREQKRNIKTRNLKPRNFQLFTKISTHENNPLYGNWPKVDSSFVGRERANYRISSISDATATVFYAVLFLCGYYSRVETISLESPQISTMTEYGTYRPYSYVGLLGLWSHLWRWADTQIPCSWPQCDNYMIDSCSSTAKA